MQAILLVGGKGTRISELYPDRHKSLIPILDRPFIEWQVEWLARGGITDIHLATGHMAAGIEEWLQSYAGPDVKITLSEEPAPLGTGGGLKFVESKIQSDPFLCLNGDSLMPNLDFSQLLNCHAEDARQLTLAVTKIDEAGRYGTVEFDEDGAVTAFMEKADRLSGWINGGVYVIDRALLDTIPAGQNVSMENDVFPRLVADGHVAACPTDQPLLDMGTPDGIKQMEAFLKPEGGNRKPE